MAKSARSLAPRRDHARALEEADRDRPDGPPRALALLVCVVEHDLVLGADRGAQGREIDRVYDRDRRGDEADIRDVLAQIVGQYGGDLGERIRGRAFERRVGLPRHEAQPEHQRLDLLIGEHQRRQHEARAQHETDAGFAVDRRTLADQRLDVA